jgi:hypothetical protein
MSTAPLFRERLRTRVYRRLLREYLAGALSWDEFVAEMEAASDYLAGE